MASTEPGRAGAQLKVARDITALALPMLAVSLIDIGMSVVDTAVIGRLGSVSLAGAALGAAVYLLCSQMIGSVAIGYQIMAARKFGAGDRVGAAALLRPLLAAALLVAPLVALAVTALAPSLLRLLASEAAVATEATRYLQVRIWTLVPLVVVLLLRMTCECDRKPAVSLRVHIVAQVVNVVLTPTLAFGWVGPELGIRGTAGASVVAMSVAMGLLGWRVSALLPEFWRVVGSRSEAAKAARLGVPEGVNSALDYAGNLTFVALIAVIGTVELAAGHIGIIVVLLTFTVCMSFAVATQILIGRSLGGGASLPEVRLLYRRSRLFLLLVGALIAGSSPLWARGAAVLFSDDEAVRQAIRQPLLVVGVVAVAMVLATHATAGLRAFGRTREVMVINVAAVWLIQVPTAYFAVQLGGGAALAWTMSAYLGYFAARAVVGDLLVRRRLAAYAPQPVA